MFGSGFTMFIIHPLHNQQLSDRLAMLYDNNKLVLQLQAFFSSLLTPSPSIPPFFHLYWGKGSAESSHIVWRAAQPCPPSPQPLFGPLCSSISSLMWVSCATLFTCWREKEGTEPMCSSNIPPVLLTSSISRCDWETLPLFHHYPMKKRRGVAIQIKLKCGPSRY